MADKLMYIPNNDTQNYPFCRLQFLFKQLDTQIDEPTNQKSLNLLRGYISQQTKFHIVTAHTILPARKKQKRGEGYLPCMK